MKRSGVRAIWSALLLLSLGGCDGDGASADGVVIVADRAVGNAPHPVTLSARVLEGEPLTEWRWDFGDGEISTEATPTHIYQAPGLYRVTLGGTEATIEVRPSADLFIQDVTASPRQLQVGAQTTIAWTWGSQAEPAVGPLDAVVYLLAEADPDAPIEVGRLTLPGEPETPTGEVAELAVTLPADLVTGRYTVQVALDPEARVGDRDRANNEAQSLAKLEVSNPLDSGPDLTFCGLRVPAFEAVAANQTPVVQLGDQLDAKLCLSNQGVGPVGAVEAALFLSKDERLDAADARLGLSLPVPLVAGDRIEVSAIADFPASLAPGTYYLIAAVDPDGDVAEQREDNNSRVLPGAFTLAEPGEVEGVDLTLAALSLDQSQVFWGQPLTGTLTLTNRGDTAVERLFVVRVLAEPLSGGTALQLPSLNLQGFEAGETEVIPLSLEISRRVAEGEYRLTAVVDPTDSTGDVQPGNNRRTWASPIRLGGEPQVDALVEGVRFSPAQVEAGNPITVEATLGNLGTDATGPLTVVVILSPDGLGNDVEVYRAEVEGLAGGTTRPLSLPVPIPLELDQQIQRYLVVVRVDPDDELTGELSEDNNAAAAIESLWVSGATGGCGEDWQHEDNDRAGGAALLTAGDYPELGACDSADWFAVQVLAGQILEVAVSADPAVGDLSLWLADEAGTRLVRGDGPPGAHAVFAPPAAEDAVALFEVAPLGTPQGYDLSVTLTAAPILADLRVRALTLVPALLTPGGSLEARFEVVNVGQTAAPASQVRVALGETATALAVPALAPSEAAALVARLSLPESLADGVYAVTVGADADAEVDEAAEDNNQAEGVVRVDREAACQADALEPNGSPLEAGGVVQQAARLTAGAYPDLVACTGDDDWYAVALAEAERLEVVMDFSHALGDLDLTLYGPDGETQLARSTGLQNRETVRLARAPQAGTYYVRAFAHPGAAEPIANDYALTVTIEPPDACGDDAFEPNGEPASAVLLPDGRHDLTLCAGDQDWFRFSIPAGNIVSFQLQSDAALTLVLQDPTGAIVGESDRRITHEATVNGLHRLGVRGPEGQVEPLAYALTVAGVSGVDLAAGAVTSSTERLLPGADLRLGLAVSNLRGDGVSEVTVRFLLSADAVASADDLRLADARLARVEGAGVAQVSARAQVPAQARVGAAFVVAVVDPEAAVADVRPSNNQAALSVEVLGRCVDDDPRSNEGPETATALALDDQSIAAVICPYTEDWYALDVPEGELALVLSPEGDAGDLDLQIYDEALTLLAESRTEGGAEALRLSTEGERLYIRVDGFADALGAYTLSWQAD